MNTDYTDNIIAKINAIPTCDDIKDKTGEELDEIKAKIKVILAEIDADSTAYFTELQTNLTNSLAILGPLNINPTNISSVITWISDFITSNITQPIETITADLILVPVELLRVSTAIANKTTDLSACIIDI